MDICIWHNPNCSKSRQTLQILHDRGIQPEVIEYLKTPPSADELDTVLNKLGLQPLEFMRQGEKEFRALGLDQETLSRQQLIAAMIENPILIQRPVVMIGEQAVIGRPPERITEYL